VLALNAALAEAHFQAQPERVAEVLRRNERVAAVVTAETPLSLKELAVSGGDLMRALALPPGPKLGELLEALLQAVLDDPSQNRAEPLLELASAYLKRS
jgi:hypothetical protein